MNKSFNEKKAPQRRGEAMGSLSISFSIDISTSPPLGSWIDQHLSLITMFYTAGRLAALSMLMLCYMPETLKKQKKFSLQLLRIRRDDIFDPQAQSAAIVMVLSYSSYEVILTLAPDLCEALGVGNSGVIFSIFTLASISVRVFAGKISDCVGRIPVLSITSCRWHLP